jgi:AcrR family transcriptional regulator
MTDQPELPDLPPRLALAWGVAERPERPPRRELSIERIVEAAVEIADAEGLGGVSMARVAQRLGFTTMSLYRYVTSKDDLLLLMQESVLDAEFPPAHEPPDWRAELREWVLFSMALFRSHSWILDMPITSAPLTPNSLRITDMGLRALRSTPLDDEEKISAILLASGYGRNAAKLGRDLDQAVADAGGDEGVTGAAFAEALGHLVDEVRFPYLRPLIASGSYAGEGQIDDIAWGLERVLDGIAEYIDARAAGAPGAGRDFATASSGDGAGTEADGYEDFAEAATIASAYANDARVKKAAAKRKEAEKRVREAQKRVRELEKSVRDARKAEAEAARVAAERVHRS